MAVASFVSAASGAQPRFCAHLHPLASGPAEQGLWTSAEGNLLTVVAGEPRNHVDAPATSGHHLGFTAGYPQALRMIEWPIRARCTLPPASTPIARWSVTTSSTTPAPRSSSCGSSSIVRSE